MYGFIWRHLPGPTWLKVIEAAVLIGAAVWCLMEYVYPWANETWDLSGQGTV